MLAILLCVRFPGPPTQAYLTEGTTARVTEYHHHHTGYMYTKAVAEKMVLDANAKDGSLKTCS